MQSIIGQCICDRLRDRAIVQQYFEFALDLEVRPFYKCEQDAVVAGILPKIFWSGIRIIPKLGKKVYNVPWAINIRVPKHISVIPFLDGTLSCSPVRRLKHPVNLFIGKAEIP